VIRTQGVPVNAVIKVCNGESFFIRGYRRTASIYRSGDRGQQAERVYRTFYMSAGGCAN
jgi:hypothetical protein